VGVSRNAACDYSPLQPKNERRAVLYWVKCFLKKSSTDALNCLWKATRSKSSPSLQSLGAATACSGEQGATKAKCPALGAGDSGHSWSGPLKAHVVREAVTLARRRKIRTLSKLQRKLLRSPFGFQHCTKMTKYEALEKNVVSNRKLPSLRQSLVRSVTQKVSVCWGFWGWSTVIDSRLPGSMAEGEELGSNLLRVAKSGLWVRAVP
jgi:hypothetical protein